MNKSIRNIISILIIVIIYATAIFEKIYGTIDFSIQSLFGKYMLYTVLGILLVFIINKYFLKNSLEVFASKKGSVLLDIALGFLLLVIMYLVSNIGRVTYARLFVTNIDRSEMVNTLNQIFSSPFYTVLLLGPFIWLTEIFMVISRSFLLNNLWELNSNKGWIWGTIFGTAILCSFTQIDNGIPNVINYFVIFAASNILYFKYRRVFPLIIAGILLQTIQFAVFWTNNF